MTPVSEKNQDSSYSGIFSRDSSELSFFAPYCLVAYACSISPYWRWGDTCNEEMQLFAVVSCSMLPSCAFCGVECMLQAETSSSQTIERRSSSNLGHRELLTDAYSAGS
jgi:hypothetical protein